MLDLATVPLYVYADWLEELGEDASEWREWEATGFFHAGQDNWIALREHGDPCISDQGESHLCRTAMVSGPERLFRYVLIGEGHATGHGDWYHAREP